MTTAWPDRMDDLLKDERTRITALDVPCTEDEKCLTFETAHVTLKLFKKPFHFEMYDKEGKLLYQDLRGARVRERPDRPPDPLLQGGPRV